MDRKEPEMVEPFPHCVGVAIRIKKDKKIRRKNKAKGGLERRGHQRQEEDKKRTGRG